MRNGSPRWARVRKADIWVRNRPLRTSHVPQQENRRTISPALISPSIHVPRSTNDITDRAVPIIVYLIRNPAHRRRCIWLIINIIYSHSVEWVHKGVPITTRVISETRVVDGISVRLVTV